MRPAIIYQSCMMILVERNNYQVDSSISNIYPIASDSEHKDVRKESPRQGLSGQILCPLTANSGLSLYGVI